MSACVSVPAIAHSEEMPRMASGPWLKLSFDAPYSLFGAFIGTAEFKVSEKMSVLTRLGYIDTRWSVKSNVNTFPDPVAAGKIGIGGRWYVHGSCMGGFHIDANIDTDVVRTISGNVGVEPPGFGNIGPYLWIIMNSVYVGYSWVTDIGFFADIIAGLEIATPVLGAPQFVHDVRDIIQQQLHLNVGWAF
jgi:hypothetical protein